MEGKGPRAFFATKSPLTSEIESGKKSATKAPVAYMLPARRFSSQQFKRVTAPSKFILLWNVFVFRLIYPSLRLLLIIYQMGEWV